MQKPHRGVALIGGRPEGTVGIDAIRATRHFGGEDRLCRLCGRSVAKKYVRHSIG